MEARGEGVPGLAHAGTLGPVLPDGGQEGISEEVVGEQRGRGSWNGIGSSSPKPLPTSAAHISHLDAHFCLQGEWFLTRGRFVLQGIPGRVRRLESQLRGEVRYWNL